MKNETQHTPTPWIVNINDWNTETITDKDGNPIARMRFEDGETFPKKDLQETEANTQLIVTAVNSHFELLKENQKLKQELANFQELYRYESKKSGELGTKCNNSAQKTAQLKALNAELLEALKEFVEDQEWYPPILSVLEREEMVKRARQAIAKAGGKDLD